MTVFTKTKKAARQGPLLCVASCPRRGNGAGEEIRTLDPNLGNGGIALSDSDLGLTRLLPIAEKWAALSLFVLFLFSHSHVILIE